MHKFFRFGVNLVVIIKPLVLIQHMVNTIWQCMCNNINSLFVLSTFLNLVISDFEIRTDFFLPALSLFCGVSPAQEHRCLEELKTDISLPISPIIAMAVKTYISQGLCLDQSERNVTYYDNVYIVTRKKAEMLQTWTMSHKPSSTLLKLQMLELNPSPPAHIWTLALSSWLSAAAEFPTFNHILKGWGYPNGSPNQPLLAKLF